MFLAKVKRNIHAKQEDFEEVMDYLFKEVRETKRIDPSKLPRPDYEMIREDVFREYHDFIEILDHLEDAGHPLLEKFDEYRVALRAAAATLFDTVELIGIFGRDRANYIEEELYYIYWLCNHYHITREMYERSKIELLLLLRQQGKLDSACDHAYLRRLGNFLSKSKYCSRRVMTEGVP
ncbi:uncharacterized protein LOC119659321 [Hermetia illucens]|uniref:uncharacterized protein LOC119659321 n=1 Tax=Hermetia illucens TaxID=343691 RepID=UPI0018CC25E7|nr:uncharacterized protein LOC119659321 [Hermetia illucens]